MVDLLDCFLNSHRLRGSRFPFRHRSRGPRFPERWRWSLPFDWGGFGNRLKRFVGFCRG
jgi:hypothetical protein